MGKKDEIANDQLVIDYQLGNQKALAILVKRWHKLFCEKSYWIVKDPDLAKDIAQDTWKTIIQKIDSLKDPKSFGSWALRIVYTKSLDAIRFSKKTNKAMGTYRLKQELENLEEHDNEQIKKALIDEIKQLPVNQRVVIRLFYVEDCSLKEISDILNISTGTAKSRLFHAREKLKKTIKNKNYEN